MVDIGKMNKRITFMRASSITDDMGQNKTVWVDFKTVWATVKPFKSSEGGLMSKLRPESTCRFYVRYIKDITADMRIKYHGRVFELSGNPVDLDEKHEMLEIQCQEVFENGRYGV